MKETYTVYAPIYDYGRHSVREIPVRKVHTACEGRLVFINGQHYDSVYATREEAEASWTRSRVVPPMTAAEILALVKTNDAV